MNQQRYRVVSNKARGQGQVMSPGAVKGLVSALCMSAGMLGLAASAHAQITADNRAGSGPAVTAAANGTPLVNINAASTAGVSLNQYQQFNTDVRGAILNNSSLTSQTQLGGQVVGNANMTNGAARIIVNQVTGNMPSNLVGSIEVAGQRAEVVLSNPNGIAVNGAGFINTSRAVLTTGTPMFTGAAGLDTLRVNKGEIVVNKLDGRSTDQVDLIARVVKINGEVQAKEALNVVAGANKVDYRTSTASPIPAEAKSRKPSVAIDVAALGGMYAKKIALVGTENGVNVGGKASATDSLMVNSAGDLVVRNGARVQAERGMELYANGNVRNNGWLESKGDIEVNGRTSIHNGEGAVLAAGGAVSVVADQDVTNRGKVIAGSNIFIHRAVNVTNDRSMVATGGDILINGSKQFTNTSEGSLQAAKNVLVNAGSVEQFGKITAGERLDIETYGGGNNNHQGGRLSAADIALSGNYVGNAGRVEATSGNVNIQSHGRFTNSYGGLIQAKQAVNLQANHAIFQVGQIKAETIDVNAFGGEVYNYGRMEADKLIKVAARYVYSPGVMKAPTVTVNGK